MKESEILSQIEKEGALEERVLAIRRVTKVITGGKRLRFSVLCAVGDRAGRVGVALAKAPEVADGIQKCFRQARKNMFRVKVVNDTIPHEVMVKFKASKMLLKPAAPGTGVIACDPVRAVLELAGIKNILTKSLGSNNVINMIQATVKALKELRTYEEVMRARGKMK